MQKKHSRLLKNHSKLQWADKCKESWRTLASRGFSHYCWWVFFFNFIIYICYKFCMTSPWVCQPRDRCLHLVNDALDSPLAAEVQWHQVDHPQRRQEILADNRNQAARLSATNHRDILFSLLCFFSFIILFFTYYNVFFFFYKYIIELARALDRANPTSLSINFIYFFILISLN